MSRQTLLKTAFILGALSLPASALANNKALYGTWKMTSVTRGGQTLPFPPQLSTWVTYDAKKYEFKVLWDGKVMQRHIGSWWVVGNTLTTQQKGWTLKISWIYTVNRTTLIVEDKKKRNRLVYTRILKKK